MTLQSEDMGKLVAGKSVLLLDGELVTFSGQWTSVRGTPGIRHEGGGASLARRCSYVGELTPDGWIEGEWAENPVPGMVVEVRYKTGSIPRQGLSDDWLWGRNVQGGTIIAFRPAHREAQPETDGGGEADTRLASVVSMLERVTGPTDSVRIYAHEAKLILAVLASKGV